MYGLPEDVIFCSKCVMSNQRPRSVVEFKSSNNQKSGLNINANSSVCDACDYNETKQKIDWEKREKELLELLEKYRKPSGYDCLVPGSGGKDSAYTAHILKYKYGMNPLTITWAPHMYTNIGWENFDNWIKVGGFDNILFTPNGKVHKLLTKLAFKNLLHPFQPFIIGQKIIGPLIALKFDIPLIFYGENQAEYGNAVDENADPKILNSVHIYGHSIGLKTGSYYIRTKPALSSQNFSMDYLKETQHKKENNKNVISGNYDEPCLNCSS